MQHFYNKLDLICSNLSQNSSCHASSTEVDDSIKINNHRQYYFKNESIDSGHFPSCRNYFAQHGYFNEMEAVNNEERHFPIAFGFLIYRNFDQFEQLLRLIYRSYNYYCIHLDNKSSASFKIQVSQVSFIIF